MENVKMDLKGAKILLVDDQPANLDVLCELLEPEGYKISIAPNGEVALTIAGRVAPDLILLDVMMPGIDGFEVCRRLKGDENTREIPVIFITAQSETHYVVAGFDAGGVDYIVKPFHDREVLARVRTHLKIDHLTHELARKNAELSRTSLQVRTASERKSRFLANIAHELRTPITALQGSADNLLDGVVGTLTGKQERYVQRIRSSADRLLNLINDLLDLSRIEAGRMDVRVERFDVKGLIAACCAEIAPLVKPGVKLNCHVCDEAGEAHTDRGRVGQIVMNLLSNAVKFTGYGAIAVRAVREGEMVVISVSDTGIGIPEEAREMIFEEFQQVKGSDPQHKGTGLGLSITKGFVELLGGTIRVESEVGKGSTFTVRIPAVYRQNQ